MGCIVEFGEWRKEARYVFTSSIKEDTIATQFGDVIRQASEALNRHDADGWAKVYAEDVVVYDLQYPEPLRGREAVRSDMAAFVRTFPDLHMEIRSILQDGNTYAYEGTMTGTQQGPLATPDGGEIPATNKRVEMSFGAFGKFDEENKIVEERRYYDLAGLLAQLGITG
jgi:steroid delta-isomerase-like uncharacterized protein